MAFQNGQTVSDVKKNISRVASDIKSEAKDLKSDLKSEAKSAASKVERKASEAGDTASSIADSVLSSALSVLPVKNAEEAFSMLESTLKDVRSGLTTARDSATDFVKKYPMYSLLGAAAIGATAVMIFRMRSSTPSETEIKYDA